MRKAEKVGIWLGAVTLLVSSAIAIGAWQWPRDPESAAPPPEPAAATATSRPAPATVEAPTASGPRVRYLSDLGPQSGDANLTALPRALAGTAGYDHPIVVRCPTNQSDDKMRTVTYPLRGRYLDFAATVRPYYTGQPDARTYVAAVSAVKERDGTLTRRTSGTQFNATMDGPAPLAAALDGAEELTIEVRCESPEGVVILAGATLTPAG